MARPRQTPPLKPEQIEELQQRAKQYVSNVMAAPSVMNTLIEGDPVSIRKVLQSELEIAWGVGYEAGRRAK